MKISRGTSIGCSVLMSVLMTNAPQMAFAESLMPENEMVSTNVVVQEMTREQAEQKVQEFLNRDEVRQKLVERGLSAEEASSRLAGLSEAELRQLAGQVDQAQYGGDILVAILIVVLIIFLIKRI